MHIACYFYYEASWNSGLENVETSPSAKLLLTLAITGFPALIASVYDGHVSDSTA